MHHHGFHYQPDGQVANDGGPRVHAKSRTVGMAKARELGVTLLNLLRG